MVLKKRGQLSSTQIILMVLAIFGFVAVLVIMGKIFLGGHSKNEVCRLSVLTRATVPSSAQGYVPLKCTTDKICITADTSQQCRDKFGGEKDITIIKVSGKDKDKAATIKKIEEISANAMYDCWSMMGQGKLDIFSKLSTELGLKDVHSSCVICSRVAVDKTVPEIWLNEVDINEYLKKQLVPGTKYTYTQAFLNDKSVSSYIKVDETALSEKATDQTSNSGVAVERRTATKINKEVAFVFMQIKSKNVGDVLKNQFNFAVAALGTTYLTLPGGAAAITAVTKAAVGTIGGWWTLVVVGGAAAVSGGYGAYNAKQGQALSATYCGPFTSQQVAGDNEKTRDEREGCSVVKAVNYDFREINNYCYSIEGNP